MSMHVCFTNFQQAVEEARCSSTFMKDLWCAAAMVELWAEGMDCPLTDKLELIFPRMESLVLLVNAQSEVSLKE
ncbi:hypothetical protein IFM89_019849 [Coptis chinensis]|uniref:Uncharacterized protein n=1 Tax=Coptis chinensis TaxID=261450 RepID=A0A835HXA0_9MAGN|nr:hypothetical protein IFM89_019849 [Coptis chinensis]